MRVLVIEDVPEMRGLIGLLLREIPGVQVSGLAANTAEARLEVGRRKPDAVLLDLILPGESGRDLLPWLVEEEGLPVWLLAVPGANRPTGRPYELARGWLVKPAPETWAQTKNEYQTAILG